MDLERVRDFAQQRKRLEDEIAAYEPREPKHEENNPLRRFENIWAKLDELAGDSLDRTVVSADDGKGTSVTITRKAELSPGEHHSGQLHYANSKRSIEARWISDGQEFTPESLADEDVIGQTDWDWEAVDRKLGTMEESVTSLENMLSDNPHTDSGLVFVASTQS